MLQLLRAGCLLGMLLVGQVAAAQNLRLVADSWPPFTDLNAPSGGVATLLVTTALTRAGFSSDFELVPWARAMLGLGEGRYDVVINAWYTQDRTLVGQFSEGYLINRVSFIKQRGAQITYDGDYSDLRPYPIAVVRGYAYSPGFDSDDELEKVPVHNFSMAVRMLAAGRVQLTLEDELVARYWLAREAPKVRDAVEFIPKPLTENRLRILVSLKNPDHEKIVAGFDREITAMKADGTYDRILKQYGM